MIQISKFTYEPGEHEAEKASNSYLMSFVAMFAGLPLPIINLLATLFFYTGNRKGTYFVRWHCMQALFSQLSLFFINTAAVWWTILIIFNANVTLSNQYFAYIIALLAINLTEGIATIYTAIQTRKGVHVQWWFFGNLTNLACKP